MYGGPPKDEGCEGRRDGDEVQEEWECGRDRRTTDLPWVDTVPGAHYNDTRRPGLTRNVLVGGRTDDAEDTAYTLLGSRQTFGVL